MAGGGDKDDIRLKNQKNNAAQYLCQKQPECEGDITVSVSVTKANRKPLVTVSRSPLILLTDKFCPRTRKRGSPG